MGHLLPSSSFNSVPLILEEAAPPNNWDHNSTGRGLIHILRLVFYLCNQTQSWHQQEPESKYSNWKRFAIMQCWVNIVGIKPAPLWRGFDVTRDTCGWSQIPKTRMGETPELLVCETRCKYNVVLIAVHKWVVEPVWTVWPYPNEG